MKKMLNEGNHIYTVSVRTSVIPFYYGSSSGSAKVTVPVPLRQKVKVPTVPQHWTHYLIVDLGSPGHAGTGGEEVDHLLGGEGLVLVLVVLSKHLKSTF
jgi:hypothetical protein